MEYFQCSNLILVSLLWGIQAFSVVVTVRNGKLEVARMKTEEPLDKANSGHPRVGYLCKLICV
jgi:hypothetical protein